MWMDVCVWMCVCGWMCECVYVWLHGVWMDMCADGYVSVRDNSCCFHASRGAAGGRGSIG